MEKKETEKNTQLFDFYTKIKEIISEYESELDELDTKENNNKNAPNSIQDPELEKIIVITLKKLMFAVALLIIFLFYG